MQCMYIFLWILKCFIHVKSQFWRKKSSTCWQISVSSTSQPEWDNLTTSYTVLSQFSSSIICQVGTKGALKRNKPHAMHEEVITFNYMCIISKILVRKFEQTKRYFYVTWSNWRYNLCVEWEVKRMKQDNKIMHRRAVGLSKILSVV